MPVLIKCQTCGKEMFVSPSTAKRIKNCSNCKNKHFRKKYKNINEKEFNKLLKEKWILLNWKASTIAEGREEIFEDLVSRYSICLFRIFARKKNVKNLNSCFNVSMNYETKAYFKEIAKTIEKEKEINKFCLKEKEDYIENKLDLKKYLIDAIKYSYSNCYELYSFCILNKTTKEISKIQKTTEKGISSRLERQRKKIKKEFPEIIKYLRG